MEKLSNSFSSDENQASISKPLEKDPVVTGMACQFPGAENITEFWEVLENTKDCITEFPNDRWDNDQLYDPTAGIATKISTRWGGFLKKPWEFDADFFGINPREVESMDPQQRILLELAWHTLEHAGIAPQLMSGKKCGVYIGASSFDYNKIVNRDLNRITGYTASGTALSILANRLSYFLNLQGPSMVIDTACSSSLTALHIATQALKSKEIDYALVGGVNLILSPETTMSFSFGGFMSPDGRCKSFSSDADGYVRSEGAGMVLLKRYEDAVRDKDFVWGAIRGTALNQDGLSNGMTAPNALAQQNVIRSALQSANISADSVSYVEAHGTGTPLGDPIEVKALASVYGQSGKCAIGSVKSNIGHTEPAAGIAGLIKVLLLLHHKKIPAIRHLVELNPQVESAKKNTQLIFPTKILEWKKTNSPRTAGISSFSFGGSNAHVIVQEVSPAIQKEACSENKNSLCFLKLSAKSKFSLQQLATLYHQSIEEHLVFKKPIDHFCYKANLSRSDFKYRSLLLSESPILLEKKLKELSENKQEIQRCPNRVKIAFLMTGQGSQFPAMGLSLYQKEPIFKQAFDECANIFNILSGRDLHALVLNSSSSGVDIHQTINAQPSIFSFEYALTILLMHQGVKPSILLGHSLGEYVAMTVAGVISLKDGIALTLKRSELMQSVTQKGSMASVMSTREQVDILCHGIQGEITVAAINSPSQCVVSGDDFAVEEFIQKAAKNNIVAKKLATSHAFHSSHMDSILDEFEAFAETIVYKPATIKIVRNVDGKISEPNDYHASYLRKHLRESVNFKMCMETIKSKGVDIYIEVGPQPVLSVLGKQCHHEAKFIPCSSSKESNIHPYYEALVSIYAAGIDLAWDKFYPNQIETQLIDVPLYPFEKKDYWLKFTAKPTTMAARRFSYLFEQDLSTTDALWENKQKADMSYAIKWIAQECKAHECKTTNVEKLLSIVIIEQSPSSFASSDLQKINVQQNIQFTRLIIDSEADLTKLEINWSSIDAILNISTVNLGDRIFENIKDGFIYVKELSSQLYLLSQTFEKLSESAFKLNIPYWHITYQSLQKNPIQASIMGFVKTAILEYPSTHLGIADCSDLEYLPALVSEITLEKNEHILSFKKADRYVPRLTKAKLAVNNDVEKSIQKLKENDLVIITGGFGSLGLSVVKYLIDIGLRNFVLTTRQDKRELPTELLEYCHQDVKIFTEKIDLSKFSEIKGLIERYQKEYCIKGIVHAAGETKDASIAKLSQNLIETVLTPKILGAYYFHLATQNIPLDFFIQFSSISSVFGSPGQANYSAANAFLDRLSTFRHEKNLSCISINWGIWEESTLYQQLTSSLQKRLSRNGLLPLSAEHAQKYFSALVLQSIDQPNQVGDQMIVANINWEKFLDSGENINHSMFSYFENPKTDYFSIKKDFSKTDHQPLVHTLSLKNIADRNIGINQFLSNTIKEILQLDHDNIPFDQMFNEYGIDSLLSMELIAKIKNEFLIELYPRELMENPTIASLTKYLSREAFSGTDTGNNKDLKKHADHTNDQPKTSNFLQKNERNLSYLHKLKPAAFILSSPRSGSTLLRAMLAGNTQLFSPPELHLLQYPNLNIRKTDLGASHLGEGLVRALMELNDWSPDKAKDYVVDLEDGEKSVYDVYQFLQSLCGQRLLVDKSPTYALSLDTLNHAEAIFSNAKYIHLVRHPYSVIESFTRMRMNKLLGDPSASAHDVAEKTWLDTNRNIIQFFNRINQDNCLTVFYEELVADPKKTLTAICQFLDVDYQETMEDPYGENRMIDGLHKESIGIGDPNFSSRNVLQQDLGENWKHIQLQSTLQHETQTLAKEFHYILLNDSDTDIQINNSVIKPDEEYREYSVEVLGHSLSVSEWGDKNGIPVILLHGILDQSIVWEQTVQHLKGNGIRVIAPDLRGHGLSSHIETSSCYQLINYVSDLSALIDALNLKSVVLVGHSLGSMVSALYSSTFPEKVKHLVLVETILPNGVDSIDMQNQIKLEIHYMQQNYTHPIFSEISEAVELMCSSVKGVTDKVANNLCERALEKTETGFVWRWDPILRTRVGLRFHGTQKQYLSLLSKISCSTTLLVGKNSSQHRNNDISLIKKALNSCKTIELEGGHNLQFEQPERIAITILEAINRSSNDQYDEL